MLPTHLALLFALTLIAALTAAPSAAQLPRVGIVDIYGARTVPPARVREAAGIAVGDTLSIRSVESARAALSALPGVTAAQLDLVCCEGERTIVYVGIAEGSVAIRFHPKPAGDQRLRSEIVAAGDSLMVARQSAVLRGSAGEDDSQGHSLMNDSAGRAIQERYVGFADRDRALLREVLRNSSDAAHRALAAEVIAYAHDKRSVVPDLLHAMRDASSAVRNSATRALGLIAALAQRRPELGLEVPPEPFIDMLRSVVWTDRNKSSIALFQLTQNRDSALLAALRARAMPELVEMARWKSPGHALFPLVIVGRIGGVSDADIFAALQRGERERVIGSIR